MGGIEKSYTPSIPECKVYSFLARILRHEKFFSHVENQERGVPNSHKLKIIRQISLCRDLTHLWSGKIV